MDAGMMPAITLRSLRSAQKQAQSKDDSPSSEKIKEQEVPQAFSRRTKKKVSRSSPGLEEQTTPAGVSNSTILPSIEYDAKTASTPISTTPTSTGSRQITFDGTTYRATASPFRLTSEEADASRLLSLARTPSLSPEPSSRGTSPYSGVETPSTPDLQPEAKRRRTTRVQYEQVGPPFDCPSPDCSDVSSNIADFRKHMLENHEKEYTLCMREDCTKTAARSDGMTMMHHYKLDHDMKLLNCAEHPRCNYRGTFDETEYKKHVASHKLRCNQCLDEGQRALPFANEANLNEHIKTAHRSKPYFCNIYDVDAGKICDKQFASEKARSQHGSRAHKGNYLCAYCFEQGTTSSFKTEVLLGKHVKAHHKDKYDVDWGVRARDRTYPCPICSKDFSSASNRAKHIRSVHEKERKWACNTTDLSDSDRLVGDQMEKLTWDYAKDGCERTFANKQTLVDHVRSEHFGYMRWEAFRKLRSGDFAEEVWAKLARKNAKSKKLTDPIGVLTGKFPEPKVEEGEGVAEGVNGDETEDEVENE